MVSSGGIDRNGDDVVARRAGGASGVPHPGTTPWAITVRSYDVLLTSEAAAEKGNDL